MRPSSRRLTSVVGLLLVAASFTAGQAPPIALKPTARIGTPALRHPFPAISVAFAPDGKTFASVSEGFAPGRNPERLVILWDAATGRELRAFTGHTAGVLSVAFSRDGKQIVTGSRDKTLRLWNVATGQQVRSFTGHTDMVVPVAYSPDGQWVASESADATVRLWEAATGREARKLPGHKSQGTSNIVFSPDSRHLATVGADFVLRLWEVATGREVRTFTGHTKDCESLDFARDGKHLASASEDGTIRLWDVATGKEVRRYEGLPEYATTVRLSPDGTILAAGGVGRAIGFWEVATGKLLHLAWGHTDNVSEISFSPDGKVLASASHDGTVRLWDVATGQSLPVTGGQVMAAALSPDGTRLATADGSRVLFWDAATGKQLPLVVETGGPVNALAFAPDGAHLATGGHKVPIRLWDLGNPTAPPRTLGPASAGTARLAFAPDGQTIASVGPRTVQLWDVATGQASPASARLDELAAAAGVANALVFSPDGTELATAHSNGQVRLWDVATGEERRALSPAPAPHGLASALAYAADGRSLAAYHSDGMVRLWERISGRERRSFKLSRPAFHLSLALSTDSRLVAAGSADGSITLWDVGSGKELAWSDDHGLGVTYLAFFPDSQRLVSASVPSALTQRLVLGGTPQERRQSVSGDSTAALWGLAEARKRLGVPTPAAPGEAEALWKDLTGTDAVRAFVALERLAAAPALALPLLRERLPGLTAPQAAPDVARLLADLDHDDFDVRERATSELIQLGAGALASVREALARTKSREVRRRAEEIVEQLRTRAAAPRNVICAVRGVELLERLGTPEARQLLSAWANGADASPLTREVRTALKRLAGM